MLHIRFKSIDDYMLKDLKLQGQKKVLIQPKNELIFASINTLENFLTGQKLHILSAIRIKKPDSIYSLAKIVNRDFANVSRDCTTLEQKGFLVLKKSSDNRGSKTPCLTFDYTIIRVHSPTEITYSYTLAA